MLQLLNEMSEMIYIVDVDNYELLYMNQSGKKAFGLERPEGNICYKVIKGRDRPCEDCPNKLLEKDSIYDWKNINPVLNRSFILKDKLIDWEGRRAKVEIAFDVTEREQEAMNLRNSLDMDGVILDCVTALHMVQDVQQAMDEIMRQIGTYLDADSTYIFEVKGNDLEMTHVWIKEEASSVIENKMRIHAGFLDSFRDAFEKRYCKIIEDISAVWDPESAEYKAINGRGIRSMVAAPLILGGQIIGFIGVNNPMPERVQNITSLLSPIEYFIESSIQRQKDQELLKNLSYRDMLTGVLNRNAFMNGVEQISAKDGVPVGVVYVDANGMKEVNDTQGHLSGDQYLKNIVGRIIENLPSADVYRVGGDEFVAISLYTDEERFEDQVGRMKRQLVCGGREIASVGYRWSDDSSSIHQLIFEADELMYGDKKSFYRKNPSSGRYRHGHDVLVGMEDLDKLRGLVADNRFLVYYQPKVSMKTRKPIGAEALVRFKTEEGKIISPGEFLPFLEESHLVHVIDFYVFEEVCKSLKDWDDRGFPVMPVSVNFSRSTLAVKNFCERLDEIWERYGLPRNYIEIEVTESIEERNREEFYTVLKKMKESGFCISIDDFGNKYANLASVIAFDYDELKVDRSLVDDIASNSKSQAVVHAIRDICSKMNVRLVVEGIENEEQYRALGDMLQVEAQGYLFGRPAPLEEYEKLYLTDR